MGEPRIGVSLSIAVSDLDSPNNSAALAACGLVSFIWPRIAPTINTSELPPICSQIYFQVQPFSRLRSSIFSVRSVRFMSSLSLAAAPLEHNVPAAAVLLQYQTAAPARLPGFLQPTIAGPLRR